MSIGSLPLLQQVSDTGNGSEWRELLEPFHTSESPAALHMAVMVQPYLDFILQGRKTVESRFSVRPIPPYRRVSPGDLILMKASGGPLVGAFTATSIWTYQLDPDSWEELRSTHADALCVDDGFWRERAAAEYATLMLVSNVLRLPSLRIGKKDRRGWVVLTERNPLTTP